MVILLAKQGYPPSQTSLCLLPNMAYRYLEATNENLDKCIIIFGKNIKGGER